MPKLTYSYDPRREAWLSQALTKSPDFVAQSKSHFTYPGTGQPQALITLEGGTLEANLLEPQVEAVESALYRAGGALLILDSVSGPTEEEFANEMLPLRTHWDPSIQEVLDDFLDNRAATVSESTLRRDQRAVEILGLYLVGIHGGWNVSSFFQTLVEWRLFVSFYCDGVTSQQDALNVVTE